MIYFSDFAAAAPATDPNFANVKLLMGFNGVDGSTSFIDESGTPHTMAGAGGQEQLDTAQQKFGSASLLLDGTFDGISTPDHADWDFGTGQFTIEAWVRVNATTGSVQPILQYGATNPCWQLGLDSDLKARLRYRNTSGVFTEIAQGAATITTGTWFHVAADRDGSGNGRVYIDGVVVAGPTTINFAHLTSGSAELWVGRTAPVSAGFNGWIDEARVTKGVGRYGGAFTPPAAAFPRS